MKKWNIAVVGATGLVGSTILKVMEERNFPVNNLIALASQRSAGKKVEFQGKKYSVEVLDKDAFKNVDIAFFAAGGSVSRQFVPYAVKAGALVIDNSSEFRYHDDVPLVVPEVNGEDVEEQQGIISNPNCSTIQCMAALKCIADLAGLERIVYSTYQSVSGSGWQGLKDLDENKQEFYPYEISGNIIPHIDDFQENGYSREEMKIIWETRKIFHDPKLRITATTARVPVRFAHCVSMNVETKKNFDVAEIKQAIADFPGMVLEDKPEENIYPLPRHAEGKDEIFVGRIRRDESLKHGLNLWIVADNIRKGAATNAVQIGEECIRRGVVQ